MLGFGASFVPEPADAAGTLGASKAFAAMLISDSPCWLCVMGAKGELGRPADEAMADGDASGLFLAMRSVRRDLSSACNSWRDDACACACLSIILKTRIDQQSGSPEKTRKSAYLWHEILDLFNLIPQVPHLLSPLLFSLPNGIHSLFHLTNDLVHFRPLPRNRFLQLSSLFLEIGQQLCRLIELCC
jgi:hypothetical protein